MIAPYLLAALRAQHTTGPAIAAALGITKQAVSLIEKGGKMSEDTAAKAAALLNLDACIVLAQLRADYADTDATRAIWLEAVARLSAGKASPPAPTDGAINTPVFIMSTCSSIANHLKPPQEMVLFPEYPAATLGMLVAWLRKVPKIEPESPRFGYYCRWWDVPGKIQRNTDAHTMPDDVLTCRVHDCDLNTALQSLTKCGFFPSLSIDQGQGDLFSSPTPTPAKAASSKKQRPPALAKSI